MNRAIPAAGSVTTLAMMPNGTPGGTRTALEFFGTDFIADGTNYERLSLRATASADFTLLTDKGGTGTVRGLQIMTGTSQPLAFHGSTAVIQRAGAAQAAVATTSATNVAPYGYAQAQADAIVTLVNELRAALVEKGLIKGSA